MINIFIRCAKQTTFLYFQKFSNSSLIDSEGKTTNIRINIRVIKKDIHLFRWRSDMK